MQEDLPVQAWSTRSLKMPISLEFRVNGENIAHQSLPLAVLGGSSRLTDDYAVTKAGRGLKRSNTKILSRSTSALDARR